MTPEEAMHYAQQQTHIMRERKNLLYTFGATRLPYVCLSESVKTEGDVIIREGEISAERPKIAIPGEDFNFEGFDFDGDDNMIPVLLARRIQFPPARYVNKSANSRTERGPIDASIEKVVNQLDQKNDIRTAVVAAPERVWNISILLYVGSQVVRSASSNVAEHFERMRLQG